MKMTTRCSNAAKLCVDFFPNKIKAAPIPSIKIVGAFLRVVHDLNKAAKMICPSHCKNAVILFT